eukprot:scaffold5507_cov127-Skeletonema_dohrnii-CCMP3373.AAC.1
MANYDGSLEAALAVIDINDYAKPRSCWLPYSQREIRYGARVGSCRPSQMPHQVSYDVVATPIRANNA